LALALLHVVAGDTLRVLRCVGAMLRKHVTLAPDKCALFFKVMANGQLLGKGRRTGVCAAPPMLQAA
jgi:hypothetical protein